MKSLDLDDSQYILNDHTHVLQAIINQNLLIDYLVMCVSCDIMNC